MSHFHNPVGARVLLQIDEPVQTLSTKIKSHGLIFADGAHHADKADFARLRILSADEVRLFHPAPGLQFLNSDCEIKELSGLRIRGAKQSFRRRWLDLISVLIVFSKQTKVLALNFRFCSHEADYTERDLANG